MNPLLLFVALFPHVSATLRRVSADRLLPPGLLRSRPVAGANLTALAITASTTQVSVGAIVATVVWLIASIGFSIYSSTFGNYAKTYGVFAGIVVLLFWLWLSMYAILLGAEINAESEQQTVQDTTKGEEKPLGERGAVKADSVPSGDPEAPQQER